MPTDDKETHAQEFTDIENETLDLWLQLENANLDDQAAKLLQAGLQFEHYTSLLDNDPGKRTTAELAKQRSLQFLFESQVRLSQDMLRQARQRVSGRTRGAWLWGLDNQWHWVEGAQ